MIQSLFSQRTYAFLIFLYTISLFINQAPHNAAVIICSLFGIGFLIANKGFSLAFIRKNKSYITTLLLFFILFLLINLYHFGFNNDFTYALSRVRWIIYSIILIPFSVLISKSVEITKLKEVFQVYFLPIFVLLSLLIFIDSFTRVIFSEPSTSSWIKSSLNDVFGNRAAWTINPIPFSKLSFMATLIFGFFYLKSKDSFYKVLFFILSLGMLSVTLLTQTRASWLGIAAIAPIFLIFIPQTRKLFLILLVLFSGLLILKPNNFLVKRLYSFKETKSLSNRYRLEHAKANLKLSFNNPLLGVGYASNSKKSVIGPYLNKFTKNEGFLYQHPHNQYLDMISGVGYPISILFLSLLIWPLALALKTLKTSPNKVLWSMIASYQIFMLITACFDRITSLEWSALILSWCLVWTFKDQKQRDSY